MKKIISILLVFVLLLSVIPTAFAAETTEYIVQSGDSLSVIAQRYHTTKAAIMALNPQITDENKIKVGDKLIIPVVEETEPVDDGYVHYTVQSGDTLSVIAKKYNTTVAAIMALNPKITNADNIRQGQDIIVGVKGETPDTPVNPDTPVDDGYVHHIVLAGETLSEIAVKYNTTQAAIMALNPEVTNANQIREGQDLIVGVKGEIPDNPDQPDIPDIPDVPVEPTIPELTAPSHTFFEDSVSVNFKNTNTSDILNILSHLTGKNIIFTGEDKAITVKATGTLKVVLDAICKADGGLSVLISGNSCFVGPKDALADTKLPYKEASKLVTLKNIKAADLVKILEYLKLPEYKSEASADKAMQLTVTATPYNMASVLAAINAIDRAENIVNGSFNWKKLPLANLDAATVASYAEYFGFGDNIIRDNSTDAVFVCGTSADITELATLVKLLDKPALVTAYLYTAENAELAISKVAQTDKNYAAVAHRLDGKIYLIGTAADINTYYSALEYYRTAQ